MREEWDKAGIYVCGNKHILGKFFTSGISKEVYAVDCNGWTSEEIFVAACRLDSGDKVSCPQCGSEVTITEMEDLEKQLKR